MTNTLQEIATDKLTDHPKNPRLIMREDVIDGIVANLNGEYPQKHALHVRPQGDGFEILSGHHRKRAAEKAGFESVWCWVEDMDDDTAFMELATSNNQGELSPLEIGMHALHYVEKATGGRGNKGGLSAYAEKVGRPLPIITRNHQGAAVAGKVLSYDKGLDTNTLLTKAAHLAAIHKLPEETWQEAVEIMLKKGWSAAETSEKVKAASDQTTPKRIIAVFAGKTSRQSISRIDEIRESFSASLESDTLRDEWIDWHTENDPLDLVEVKRMRDQLEERDATGDPAVVEKADAVEWLKAQDDCDLLLTDPPYSTDVDDIEAFAKSWLPTALAKVKPTGRAYVCIGAYPKELAAYCNVAMPDQVLVWTYRNTIGPTPSHDYKLNWQAILYYKGKDAPRLDSPEMMEQMAVQDINAPDGRQGDRFHTWQKPDELAERIVRHATQAGDLVLDPFCCTGTFALAAQRLGRTGRGCDISDENLKIAKERGCHYDG